MSIAPLSLVCHPLTVHFHPSRWGDHFLNVNALDQETKLQMEQEARQLKEEVKKELLATANKPILELEFIDAIERLGLAYHFETEIEEALLHVFESYHHQSDRDDLYHISLRFRILRQHGFHVSSNVFKRFKDDEGGFKGCVRNDVWGILSLYEASHVRIQGDDILDEALEFTTNHLKNVAKKLSSPLAEEVSHALHQPLHKGIVRLESKHYISFYQHHSSHNKTLLNFAKLDFNLLQASHQMELKDLTAWWKGLLAKLPFTRDRLVEGYFWTLGCYYEPQYSVARKIFAKIFMVLQILDDIYDAYGTLEERQLLTEAVHRWDYGCISQLPEYFNHCYQALLETLGEVEQELEKEGRSFCMHYAKEQTKHSCQAWFQESKWCQQKDIPTYDKYMDVALVSVCQVLGIVTSYLGMGKIATKEGFQWVCQHSMPTFVKASSLIFRLMNDIGSHKFEQKRKHVPSSVQCYMGQHGIVDEEKVYKVLEKQVEDAWKDVNQAMLRPYAIPKPLLERILNLTRVPDVIYKGRTDGYTTVNETIKHKIASILIDPIPM